MPDRVSDRVSETNRRDREPVSARRHGVGEGADPLDRDGHGLPGAHRAHPGRRSRQQEVTGQQRHRHRHVRDQ